MESGVCCIFSLRRRSTCGGGYVSVRVWLRQRGVPCMGCHSPGAADLDAITFRCAFLLPTFLWQGRPEGSPLGGQRKVGAAPHRGDANKPISNQGKAKKQKNLVLTIPERNPNRRIRIPVIEFRGIRFVHDWTPRE